MKNLPVLLSFLLAGFCSQAQYTPVTPLNTPAPSQEDSVEKEKKGFDPQRLVIGGNLGASFGTYTFVNVSPQVGYMFNQYITAGVGINYLYESAKYYDGSGRDFFKQNYSYAGMNLFARVFPIRFLFLSAQPELNYSWGKRKYVGQYDNYPDEKLSGEFVPVFLVGAGAVLSPGGKGGVFLSIQYDVIQNYRSPYGTKPYLNVGFGF